MAVSCKRRVDALWCSFENSNAWVWIRDAGWRKLSPDNDDAVTNMLILAAQAKKENALVKIREAFEDGHWTIKEIYDFSPGSDDAATEVSFSVSECIYGWTAAFQQKGTKITVRIKLDPDSDVSSELLEECKERWKAGIESKWSYRFACCSGAGCTGGCALTFQVDWVSTGQHHTVQVSRGDARSNMTHWWTDDSGDVASHEFGHMLGHPDEYDDDNCPSRNPVNTGTVMDDNSEVVSRLCKPFCDRISQNTVPA
jgi:hypothetical protein